MNSGRKGHEINISGTTELSGKECVIHPRNYRP